MYKKRFLAAILAAALTASLASCGNNASNTGSSTPQESQTSGTEVSTPETPEVTSVDGDVNLQTYPIVEEKIELTLWYPMAGSMGELSDFNKDAEFWPWYEEKTNIHINFQIPAAGTETDAFQLLFASDAMPDLVYSQPGSYSYRGGEDKAIEDGYFIDMAEYLEYAPNYTSWLNNHDDFRTASYSDTGKMYGMWGLWKTIGDMALADQGLAIRQDFLDKVGMEIPTTYDEWYEVLKAFRDELGIAAPLHSHGRHSHGFPGLFHQKRDPGQQLGGASALYFLLQLGILLAADPQYPAHQLLRSAVFLPLPHHLCPLSQRGTQQDL